MKCCDIKPGELRTRIYIERKVRVSDGAGGFTETWKEDPPGGVYAKIGDVGGQLVTGAEQFQSMRIMPRTLLSCFIRFRDDGNGAPYYSSSSDRVIINGRKYNIEAVYDPDFRRRWIQLNLTETEPS